MIHHDQGMAFLNLNNNLHEIIFAIYIKYIV